MSNAAIEFIKECVREKCGRDLSQTELDEWVCDRKTLFIFEDKAPVTSPVLSQHDLGMAMLRHRRDGWVVTYLIVEFVPQGYLYEQFTGKTGPEDKRMSGDEQLLRVSDGKSFTVAEVWDTIKPIVSAYGTNKPPAPKKIKAVRQPQKKPAHIYFVQGQQKSHVFVLRHDNDSIDIIDAIDKERWTKGNMISRFWELVLQHKTGDEFELMEPELWARMGSLTSYGQWDCYEVGDPQLHRDYSLYDSMTLRPRFD